jgi:hypothetical protein
MPDTPEPDNIPEVLPGGRTSEGHDEIRVKYKTFQESWHLNPADLPQRLFDEAAQFASELGPRRLIGISHSEAMRVTLGPTLVFTVWYWDREPEQSKL